MMTVRLFHNPRCSKSRATLELLQQHGHDPEIVLYLQSPPSAAQISELLALLELDARGLMRKGEAEYRELGLDDPGLSETQLIAAMHAHPRLIQRPIVIADGQARIGRPPESVLDIL